MVNCPYPIIRVQGIKPCSTFQVVGMCTHDPRPDMEYRIGESLTTSAVQSIYHNSTYGVWMIDTYNTTYILDFPDAEWEKDIVEKIKSKVQ